MLTVEEVAHACDLKNPAEFQGGMRVDGEWRATGRTTTALIHAVRAISAGREVHIYAHTALHARQLANQLREMCRKCNLDPGLVRGTRNFKMAVMDARSFNPRNVQLVFDHHTEGDDWLAISEANEIWEARTPPGEPSKRARWWTIWLMAGAAFWLLALILWWWWTR